MKKLLLAVAFGFLILQAPAPAYADQKIYFNPFPKGDFAKQVKALWRLDPDYKNYVDAMDMAPDYMLGEYDLNGDGKPEIFARHSDPVLGFCDTKGFACRMNVYANVKGSLVEIGEMMTGDPVTVSEKRHNGIRDVIVTPERGKTVRYEWDGKVLQKK